MLRTRMLGSRALGSVVPSGSMRSGLAAGDSWIGDGRSIREVKADPIRECGGYVGVSRTLLEEFKFAFGELESAGKGRPYLREVS